MSDLEKYTDEWKAAKASLDQAKTDYNAHHRDHLAELRRLTELKTPPAEVSRIMRGSTEKLHKLEDAMTDATKEEAFTRKSLDIFKSLQ